MNDPLKDYVTPEYEYYLEEFFLGRWTKLASFNNPVYAHDRLKRYRRAVKGAEFRVVDAEGEALPW